MDLLFILSQCPFGISPVLGLKSEGSYAVLSCQFLDPPTVFYNRLGGFLIKPCGERKAKSTPPEVIISSQRRRSCGRYGDFFFLLQKGFSRMRSSCFLFHVFMNGSEGGSSPLFLLLLFVEFLGRLSFLLASFPSLRLTFPEAHPFVSPRVHRVPILRGSISRA